MQEVGEILHRARSGRLIIRLAGRVEAGTTLVDAKGRKAASSSSGESLNLWDPKADSELYRTYCPNCGDRLIGDSDKGEQVCQACGYVAAAGADEGPEWKAIDLEEKTKRVRVGSPTTLTLHDLGLSTDIGSDMRDSHGKYLDPTMRATVEKMRKWQSRVRTINSQERGLSIVLAKITEVCDNLNLPRNVAETAAHIYRTSVKLKVAKSKSIMGMTA